MHLHRRFLPHGQDHKGAVHLGHRRETGGGNVHGHIGVAEILTPNGKRAVVLVSRLGQHLVCNLLLHHKRQPLEGRRPAQQQIYQRRGDVIGDVRHNAEGLAQVSSQLWQILGERIALMQLRKLGYGARNVRIIGRSRSSSSSDST